MSKIDQLNNAVDQGVTQRNNGNNRAVDETNQDLLNQSLRVTGYIRYNSGQV
jgi:hypothetical protein